MSPFAVISDKFLNILIWLFNAATFALTGRVSENPSSTSSLHKVIDGVCEGVQ